MAQKVVKVIQQDDKKVSVLLSVIPDLSPFSFKYIRRLFVEAIMNKQYTEILPF